MSNIITTAELETYTGKPLDAGRADLVVDAVNQFIETRTGRVWGELKTVTEVSNAQTTTFLKQMDVISVTSVKLGRGSSQSTLSSDAYLHNGTGQLTLLGGTVFRSPYGHLNALAVEYEYGVMDVPADLKLAALSLAADSYNNASNGEKDARSASAGSYSVQYASSEATAAGKRYVSTIFSYRKVRS